MYGVQKTWRECMRLSHRPKTSNLITLNKNINAPPIFMSSKRSTSSPDVAYQVYFGDTSVHEKDEHSIKCVCTIH